MFVNWEKHFQLLPLNKLLLHVRIWPVGLHIASGRGKVCLCPLVGFNRLLYALLKSKVA
jgi:hypothetical protein